MFIYYDFPKKLNGRVYVIMDSVMMIKQKVDVINLYKYPGSQRSRAFNLICALYVNKMTGEASLIIEELKQTKVLFDQVCTIVFQPFAKMGTQFGFKFLKYIFTSLSVSSTLGICTIFTLCTLPFVARTSSQESLELAGK